jgi:hypothetical protein
MRGFVYNFLSIVNKKILPRVKQNSGINDDYPFENHVQDTVDNQRSRGDRGRSLYKFQPACQQLQGMQHLDS